MTASIALTCLVTVLYVGISLAHASGGRAGLAIAFAGYAFANIGLVLAERGQ